EKLYSELKISSSGRKATAAPVRSASSGAARTGTSGAAPVGAGKGPGTGSGTGTGNSILGGNGLSMKGDGLPDSYGREARQKGAPVVVVAEGGRGAVWCVVEFTIARDGTLSGFRVKKSTGDSRLDGRALDALKAARKFSPLPDSFKGSSTRREMTFSFAK